MRYLFLTCLFACELQAYQLPPALRPMGLMQTSTTVKVENLCVQNDPFEDNIWPMIKGGWGSGVILDSRHVMTAAHVVECAYFADVHVVLENGNRYRMVVTAVDRTNDLAKLELASADNFGRIAPPIVAPPTPGSIVCHASAYPERRVDCGKLEGYNESANGYEGAIGAPVTGGNSGGPVYDEPGHLIGITTRRMTTDIGGYFATLFLHLDWIKYAGH